ncbi:hemicentin-2-like [Frankliniella occidentalis]|uniref:Hemicentin-2-like n=1 Tax=Frankliniella occidentalis TaxID=133901 RepID=A0A9C6WV08_FRAOC|nr:hemicentin-2-like [Frankliniella occidentalis]
MKGTRDITNSGRAMRENVGDYVRLTLKRAILSDGGTYFIVAKNIFGTDRAFFTVQFRQRARSLTPVRHRRSSLGPGDDFWEQSGDWPSTGHLDDASQILRDIHERSKTRREVPGPIAGEPVIADSGRNCVTLTWPKPIHHGDAPVLAYRVEAWRLGSEGGARWGELGISPTNAYDAFGLVAGADYRLRITPRNRHGWGEALVSAPLRVQPGAPTLPEFTRPLAGHIKALRGQDIVIECQVRGDPSPQTRWTLDLDAVEAKEGHIALVREGGLCRLTLTGVREDDAGRYCCEASNSAGRVSTFVRLQVVSDPQLLHADTKLRRDAILPEGDFPPQFTMRLRDRRVQQSYPVRLTCQAVGCPEPSVTWQRDGEALKENDRISFVRSDDGFHSLDLSGALLEDGGEYSATATSALGAVTCRCTLVVDKGIRAYVAPEFVAEVGPAREVEVREGEDLHLFAIVEAYPSVGVVWHRDAVRLRQSQHTTATLDRDGRVELDVRHVTARDAGLYTCTASNEVGRATSTARVRVVPADGPVAATLVDGEDDDDAPPASDLPYSKEPAFIRKPRSFDVEEGDNVLIVCEVVGDPKPEVSWLRDWLKPDYYHHSPQFVRVGSGPEYRLEIPQARLDFTGTYAILARNQHGEAKAIISLQVFAKGE